MPCLQQASLLLSVLRASNSAQPTKRSSNALEIITASLPCLLKE